MSLIQKTYSILRTWAFKKKVLSFSERFPKDPQACFYCPEMCRFSCPTAETLRTNAITPRGKMSLLHLANQGFRTEQVTGTEQERQWFLEQCTGCGRCTEYCLHEVDVASNLRLERSKYFDPKQFNEDAFLSTLKDLNELEGVVLFCEPGRREWWKTRIELLQELDDELKLRGVVEARLPHREWAWGKLGQEQISKLANALNNCKRIWVESPEVAWFLAKACKEELEILKPEIRLVWQKFFGNILKVEFSPDVVFHESFHLTRLFPRLGYSIPMYERGILPQHHGWNSWDCGGEAFYKYAHPQDAGKLAKKFLDDLVKDGRTIRKIVCQSTACVEHLKSQTHVPVTYWLDEASF